MNTKKNILLLTTIYPAPDLKNRTSVIHFFTKEWVKSGLGVKVIYFNVIYPRIFYFIAKLFREKIASVTGAIVDTSRANKNLQYSMDGVTIHRIPLFKLIPQGRFSEKILKAQPNRVFKINTESNFIPDIIIGHFSNPQIFLVCELKKIYPQAKTCIVMHDAGANIKKIYKSNYIKLINSIDIWGFRSKPFKESFEAEYGKRTKTFMCYSGIPKEFIIQNTQKHFSDRLYKFVYVGDFIKLKNIIPLIKGLYKAYPDKMFELSLIGSGYEEANIISLINTLELKKNIKFLGRLNRNDVMTQLQDADCFIMISAPEAFGLVYLEAMANGCITIGSRNEGIDGVIKHEVNGFLCEAGNDRELAEVIHQINRLAPEDRLKISKNAMATAKEMTDTKVAEDYITSLIK